MKWDDSYDQLFVTTLVNRYNTARMPMDGIDYTTT